GKRIRLCWCEYEHQLIFCLLPVISASTVSGYAQVSPFRIVNLRFFVNVPHAARLEGPNAFRIYGEPDEIDIELSVIHDGPAAMSGDHLDSEIARLKQLTKLQAQGQR